MTVPIRSSAHPLKAVVLVKLRGHDLECLCGRIRKMKQAQVLGADDPPLDERVKVENLTPEAVGRPSLSE